MRRAAGMMAAALLLGGLSASAGMASDRPQVTGETPRRVVSLNLCTDQLAALLLPPERIAALSFLSRDEGLSHVAGLARDLPVVQGMAEEVLELAPDLVLAGSFTTRPTVALLKARGVPVLELGLISNFDDIRTQTREIAAALGVPERGEELLKEMEAKLAAAAPSDAARPSALTFAPGGFTAGSGTLSDAVMQAAGLENYAAGQGLIGYGYLPVETVAASPPDLLVADTDPDGYPSLSGRLLAHPALARSVGPEARPQVPGSLWTCGGPFTADAVTLLAEARARLLQRAAPQVAQAPERSP